MDVRGGTVVWAREVLGPMLARYGFVPGQKGIPRGKNSRFLVSRQEQDSALIFEFVPGALRDTDVVGGFYVYFGIKPDDGREDYARTAFVDLLSVELRGQFIQMSCEILSRVPQPGENAFAWLGTRCTFEWYAPEDLEAWVAFIERALPVVIARTRSGTPRGGGLNPGPGPDCGAGRLDRKILDALAESARKSMVVAS